mmetsp:Transcript_4849/g.15918  ORF Transcript_4849/g.15918 Transcript_4849/m.15918 type:complete len:255 (-) Transcript_4849:2142-2906(-)
MRPDAVAQLLATGRGGRGRDAGRGAPRAALPQAAVRAGPGRADVTYARAALRRAGAQPRHLGFPHLAPAPTRHPALPGPRAPRPAPRLLLRRPRVPHRPHPSQDALPAPSRLRHATALGAHPDLDRQWHPLLVRLSLVRHQPGPLPAHPRQPCRLHTRPAQVQRPVRPPSGRGPVPRAAPRFSRARPRHRPSGAPHRPRHRRPARRRRHRHRHWHPRRRHRHRHRHPRRRNRSQRTARRTRHHARRLSPRRRRR